MIAAIWELGKVEKYRRTSLVSYGSPPALVRFLSAVVPSLMKRGTRGYERYRREPRIEMAGEGGAEDLL